MKARTVVGRGEEGPPCDPGSELLTTGMEGEEISAGIIKGDGKEEKRKKTKKDKSTAPSRFPG